VNIHLDFFNHGNLNMKRILWIITTISLAIYLTSCATINELAAKMDKRIYDGYTNQTLVKWYKEQFFPKIEILGQESSNAMYVYEKIYRTYLGVKIDYSEEMNYQYHDSYSHVHNNALKLYKQYIQQRKGSIQGYKPALTKTIIKTGHLRMIERDRLRSCSFERMFIGKVNDELDSAFLDVTCYYPHPIISGSDVNSTYGWIAVIEAKVLRKILDRLPNSLLMETRINY